MFEFNKVSSGFAVDDLQAARDFYGGTLGIPTSDEHPEHLLVLHLPDERDTLVYLRPDFQPATYTILNFQVADINDAVTRNSRALCCTEGDVALHMEGQRHSR